MDNSTEILKRVKLLMEYDMSKTYSENISSINEQSLPPPQTDRVIDFNPIPKNIQSGNTSNVQTQKKSTDKDWEKYPCITKFSQRVDLPKYGVIYQKGSQGDRYFLQYFANGRFSKETGEMGNFKCEGDVIKIEEPSSSTQKPPYVWKDSPFRNQQEGDLFRQWMNTNYPEFSKSIRLDPKGKHNNWYIEKAWKSKGKESGNTYGELYKSDTEITPSVPKSASGQLQANTEPLNAQPQSVQPVSTSNLTEPQTTKKDDRQYNRFVRQQERQPKSATRY
jgi:hypothetical protein